MKFCSLKISFKFLIARYLLKWQTPELFCSFSISKLLHGLWITSSAFPYHPTDTDCCFYSRAGRRDVCLYSSKIVQMQIHLPWRRQLLCSSVNLIPSLCSILLTLLYSPHLRWMLEPWLWGVNNILQQKSSTVKFCIKWKTTTFHQYAEKDTEFLKNIRAPPPPKQISISDRNCCINSYS